MELLVQERPSTRRRAARRCRAPTARRPSKPARRVSQALHPGEGVVARSRLLEDQHGRHVVVQRAMATTRRFRLMSVPASISHRPNNQFDVVPPPPGELSTSSAMSASGSGSRSADFAAEHRLELEAEVGRSRSGRAASRRLGVDRLGQPRRQLRPGEGRRRGRDVPAGRDSSRPGTARTMPLTRRRPRRRSRPAWPRRVVVVRRRLRASFSAFFYQRSRLRWR